MKTLSLVLPALLSALACCGPESPVRRVVTLKAEDGLPTASTALIGSSLRVELHRLEALEPGRRYFLWARLGDAWTPAGELTSNSTLLMGQPWEQVEELLVSDEGDVLASAPAPLVLFRGPVGGALEFNGPSLAELKAARLTTILENHQLTPQVQSLPELSGAMYYGVWLHGAAAHDEEPERTFLGWLNDYGGALTSEELLALHAEVVITLELEHGVTEEGSVLFRGLVLDPTATPAATTEAPASHQH